MTASIDKALLSEIYEVISAVQSYLEQELRNENLSALCSTSRALHSQTLSALAQKIQSSYPYVHSSPSPALPSRPPPQMRPPIMTKPPPPVPDENYDVLEIGQSAPPQAQASDYLAPSQSQEEPQEEYLEMERQAEDQVQEEMYEDFAQPQDSYSKVTLSNGATPILSPPPTQPAPAPPLESSQGSDEGAAYMDPKFVVTKDNRASTISEDMIADWETTYLEGGSKKKEKVKASNLKDVTMKGVMEKLGGRNQNTWQKRYAVVSGMFLYFYEKESSSTYNNRIPIPGFVPSPVSKLTRPQRKEFGFKLSNTTASGKTTKDYYLRVKTEEDRTRWIDAIRAIFDLGKGIEQTRKAATMPIKSFHNATTVQKPPLLTPPPPIPTIQESTIPDDIGPQEDYEAVGTGFDPPQEDYEALDPIPQPISEPPQEDYEALEPIQSQIEQEEYVDVTGPVIEEQEEYVDLQPMKPPIPSQPTTRPSKSPPVVTPPPTRPIPTARKSSQPLPPPPEPVVNTNKVYIQQPAGIEYKHVYVLLWDFNGADRDELSVKRGDLVLVNEPKVGQEWWYGELLDQDCSRKLGPTGLFPSSYSTVAFELAVA